LSRFLVTGAGGFIGSRLCKYLRLKNHEVWALLHRPGEGAWDRAFCCELKFQSLPEGLMESVDGVFHLANITSTDLIGRDSDLYNQVNVKGTVALLKEAVESGVGRFVYFSSVKAVGDPCDECVDESWTLIPSDSYGRSKREAEMAVLEAGVISGMHVCNLRPTLVYGPGVQGNLYQMLKAIEQGRFPPLPEFGDRRSMLSLDDLIAAAMCVMEDPRANNKTYILTDGIEYSSRKLYLASCNALGLSVPSWYLPKSILHLGASIGDGLGCILNRKMKYDSEILLKLEKSACYRSENIQNELGWHPEESFYDELPAIVRYI